MAGAVRQSNRQSLDDLAKKFNLQLGETPLVSASEPLGDLGNTPELHQALFQLRPGELSQPLQVPQGFVILTPKDVQPAHQGTLPEVRDRVIADYQQEKSIELARTKVAHLLTKLPKLWVFRWLLPSPSPEPVRFRILALRSCWQLHSG
jgi:hypothetical protein